MESLKSYLAEARQETARLAELKRSKASSLLKACRLKSLVVLAAELRQLEQKPKEGSDLEFIFNSNLSYMAEDLRCGEEITYGADPEFILCDRKNKDEVVLFSSEHAVPAVTSGGKISMSQLAVGADYGLLEIRPSPTTSPEALVAAIKSLLFDFEESQIKVKKKIKTKQWKVHQALKIKKVEAIEFDHKRQRMRRQIENPDADFGLGYRDKEVSVATASSPDVGIAAMENQGTSLSAYNKPAFTQGSEKFLTAGGHLHFGGQRIRMLSMEQLKSLIRKLDEKLVPLVAQAETPAAEIRRKFYGFPGEFRLKEYGFEYRVPSCAPFWPDNEQILEKILEAAKEVIVSYGRK